jgi:hypothetical protein
MAKYPCASTFPYREALATWNHHTIAGFDAGWSSPVARQAHNLKVVGSNPTPATKIHTEYQLDSRDERPFSFFPNTGPELLGKKSGLPRACDQPPAVTARSGKSSAQNWRKPHKIPLSENHLAPAEDLRGLPATNLMLSAQLIIVDTRRGFDWRSSRRLQRGLFRGWKRTNARAA